MFLFCLVFAMFCARLFICALWSPAGKGLTSWLSFVVSSVSLLLSHWYPGSGVVLDCIYSWSLHHYLLLIFITIIGSDTLWFPLHVPPSEVLPKYKYYVSYDLKIKRQTQWAVKYMSHLSMFIWRLPNGSYWLIRPKKIYLTLSLKR